MSDVFISYAHVDKFWVDDFVLALEQKVNQYTGRADNQRIWKDNRIEGNKPFDSEIMSSLQSARCLVVCLSPGYLESKWCLRELQAFLDKTESTSSIFCIELDHLSLEEKPKVLTQTLNYRFWYEDALSKRTYPLAQNSESFTNCVIDVAKGITKQLNTQEVRTCTTLNSLGQSSSWGKSKVVNPRRHALESRLAVLYQEYDLETRIEERLRLEPVIARAEATLKSLID